MEGATTTAIKLYCELNNCNFIGYLNGFFNFDDGNAFTQKELIKKVR